MNATIELLGFTFVQKALLGAVILAIASGVLGPVVIARRMSFTVHGCSELALTGAAAALVGNFSVPLGAIVGCLIAAVVLALLSIGKPDRDAIIGVVMSFGLGIAVALLHMYKGRQYQALSLLTGQVISLDNQGLTTLFIVCAAVSLITFAVYPQLIFITVEPDLAQSRGLSARIWTVFTTVIVALICAEAVQLVGSLLVMSLLITPAAAARYITHSVQGMVIVSTVIAIISAAGGIIISLGPGWPVSAPITAVAFGFYVLARIIARIRA